MKILKIQFINVQVQYFVKRETSEKIWEQAKKSILKKLLGRVWPSFTVGYLLLIGLAEKVEAIWSV